MASLVSTRPILAVLAEGSRTQSLLSCCRSRQVCMLEDPSQHYMRWINGCECILQAILMSHDRAISKPPPRAEPSMAAMVGIGRLPERAQRKSRTLSSVFSECLAHSSAGLSVISSRTGCRSNNEGPAYCDLISQGHVPWLTAEFTLVAQWINQLWSGSHFFTGFRTDDLQVNIKWFLDSMTMLQFEECEEPRLIPKPTYLWDEGSGFWHKRSHLTLLHFGSLLQVCTCQPQEHNNIPSTTTSRVEMIGEESCLPSPGAAQQNTKINADIWRQHKPAQKIPGTTLQMMTLRTLLFFLISCTASNIWKCV